LEKEDDTGNIVKPPAEVETGSKWKPFKEGIVAYLNSIKGTHSIPLAYVIREPEIPKPNQAYQSEHHRLIEIMPLIGLEFEEDNGKLFDLLKSWTLNGPAKTWMCVFTSTCNGRATLQSLITHFEGDAQHDCVKHHAYASIANAKYYGERKKLSFEAYITIHQDADANL
jgi:hypothetical protein